MPIAQRVSELLANGAQRKTPAIQYRQAAREVGEGPKASLIVSELRVTARGAGWPRKASKSRELQASLEVATV